MKCTSDQIPELVRREGSITRLFFGFVAVEKTVGEEIVKNYEGNNVDITGAVSYDSVVSAIITSEYPAGKCDALFANRELVRDNPACAKADEYVAEYNAFQAWRVYAKDIATQILNSL